MIVLLQSASTSKPAGTPKSENKSQDEPHPPLNVNNSGLRQAIKASYSKIVRSGLLFSVSPLCRLCSSELKATCGGCGSGHVPASTERLKSSQRCFTGAGSLVASPAPSLRRTSVQKNHYRRLLISSGTLRFNLNLLCSRTFTFARLPLSMLCFV